MSSQRPASRGHVRGPSNRSAPRLRITVVGHHVRSENGGGALHTLYILDSPQGKLYRRFSEFFALYTAVKDALPRGYSFPPRFILGNLSEKVILDRRHALQEFLDVVTANTPVMQRPVTRAFVDVTRNPSYIHALEPVISGTVWQKQATGWRKYHCSLKDTRLSFFLAPYDIDTEHVLDVARCTVVPSEEFTEFFREVASEGLPRSMRSRAAMFALNKPATKQEFLLATDGEDEAHRWCDALLDSGVRRSLESHRYSFDPSADVPRTSIDTNRSTSSFTNPGELLIAQAAAGSVGSQAIMAEAAAGTVIRIATSTANGGASSPSVPKTSSRRNSAMQGVSPHIASQHRRSSSSRRSSKGSLQQQEQQRRQEQQQKPDVDDLLADGAAAGDVAGDDGATAPGVSAVDS